MIIRNFNLIVILIVLILITGSCAGCLNTQEKKNKEKTPVDTRKKVIEQYPITTLFLGKSVNNAQTEGNITYFTGKFTQSWAATYDHSTGLTEDFLTDYNGKPRGIGSFSMDIGPNYFWADPGLGSTGLHKINKKTRELEFIQEKDGLHENIIFDPKYINGLVYIGYRYYGIGVYNPKTGEVVNYPYNYQETPDDNNSYNDGISGRGFALYKDDILVYTFEVGVLKFKDGKFLPFYEPWNEEWFNLRNNNGSLASVGEVYFDDEVFAVSIFCSPVDYQGKLYIKYKDEYYREDKVRDYFSRHDQINSIIRLKNKLVMVHNSGILIYNLETKAIEQELKPLPMGLADSFLISIDLEDKYIWVGTSGGANRIDREWFVEKYIDNSSP